MTNGYALRRPAVHPIFTRPDSSPGTPLKHFTPAKPGTRLGGFDVVAEIGKGAASIIYLAKDPKTKQIKALKHVLKNEAKDQRFLDQAEAEYAVSQKIDSPYFRKIERVIKARAKLIQVKELFLVMEYVDGVSMELHPPSTLGQALRIFLQTAQGLEAMHEAGFVHADMKPNNVVLCDDGQVKIIDLGQACAIGTVKERIQGTPDYIAPEQVHRRAIVPQTDIYNLGATMYWVLTHKHIPTALTGKSDSLVEGLDADQIARPTPACEVNPNVPELLSALIDRCVEVKVEDRPASMGEVVGILEDLVEDYAESAGSALGAAES